MHLHWLKLFVKRFWAGLGRYRYKWNAFPNSVSIPRRRLWRVLNWQFSCMALLRQDDRSLDDSLRRSSSQEDDYEQQDLRPSFYAHVPSVEEKRRLWIQNATVNTMFIGSWWVIEFYSKSVQCAESSTELFSYPGSSSRYFSQCITNGCFPTLISISPILCSSRRYIWSSNLS